MQGQDNYIPVSEPFTSPKDSSPVHDHYFFNNYILIYLEIFCLIVEAFCVIFLLVLKTPTGYFLMGTLPAVPVIILLAVFPFSLRIRVDEVNRTIDFHRRTILPFVCKCKDKTFRMDDIKEFSIEKIFAVGKKNFTVYVNYKRGKERELIWFGQDPKCSEKFDPKLDAFILEMNSFLPK